MDSSSSNSENLVDNKVIQQLSEGLLEQYYEPLATIKTHLKELLEKQDGVLTMLITERRHLDDSQVDVDLDALLANIATDTDNLVSMSNTMIDLHKRVQALVARANNVNKAAIKLKAASQKPSTSS